MHEACRQQLVQDVSRDVLELRAVRHRGDELRRDGLDLRAADDAAHLEPLKKTPMVRKMRIILL